MPWTWDEINRDWLGGDCLAVSADQAMDGFNRTERVLGRDWIESRHRGVGAILTLPVVIAGQVLGSLEGVLGADKLLERLRHPTEAASAWSEARAIHLLRTSRPEATVELYPAVKVGKSQKHPDFRVRHQEKDWTYAEVAQPDVSQEHDQVANMLQELTHIVREVKKSFALEVFLRRQPLAHEKKALARRIPEFCSLDQDRSEALPNHLGLLLLNKSTPGTIVVQSYAGEEECPRLGSSTVIGGGDEPHRHISVRIAYADSRAKRFLSNEAKQLPKDHPGLIMIDMTHAISGLSSWEPLLRRCLQPTQRTRVGGISLFFGAQMLTDKGLAWVVSKKLLVNPHACLPLASWIVEAL
jgi:hypothetical protein